jgi:hypothetical protein
MQGGKSAWYEQWIYNTDRSAIKASF